MKKRTALVRLFEFKNQRKSRLPDEEQQRRKQMQPCWSILKKHENDSDGCVSCKNQEPILVENYDSISPPFVERQRHKIFDGAFVRAFEDCLTYVYKAVLCSLAQLFQNSGNKSWISSAFCVSFIKFLFSEEKNIPVEKKLKSYFEFFTIIFPINSCNAPSAS